jgi:CRP/FNR family cyclic AMP-dependent transcriptional regulator
MNVMKAIRCANPEKRQPKPASNLRALRETPLKKKLKGLIAAHPFFEGMGHSQVEWLAESAMEVEFDPGQFIFKYGDPANRFYLILSGTVSLILHSKRRGAVPVRQIIGGENLGWSWLFEPYVFYASAQAIEPTKAIFFYGTTLRQKCEDDKHCGYEIMKRMANEAVLSFAILQQEML